jgi:hypothetical protein
VVLTIFFSVVGEGFISQLPWSPAMLYGVFFVGRSQCLEQLLQLRDDVGKELNRKSTELRTQLARLGGEIASSRGRGGSVLRGKKVPPKYRDRAGNTWAGRVQNPDGWLPRLRKEKSWKTLQLKRLQGNVGRKNDTTICLGSEVIACSCSASVTVSWDVR